MNKLIKQIKDNISNKNMVAYFSMALVLLVIVVIFWDDCSDLYITNRIFPDSSSASLRTIILLLISIFFLGGIFELKKNDTDSIFYKLRKDFTEYMKKW